MCNTDCKESALYLGFELIDYPMKIKISSDRDRNRDREKRKSERPIKMLMNFLFKSVHTHNSNDKSDRLKAVWIFSISSHYLP